MFSPVSEPAGSKSRPGLPAILATLLLLGLGALCLACVPPLKLQGAQTLQEFLLAAALLATGILLYRSQHAGISKPAGRATGTAAFDAALSQHTLHLALQQAAILTMTDADGNFLHVNDRFCEISGYTRVELVGRHAERRTSFPCSSRRDPSDPRPRENLAWRTQAPTQERRRFLAGQHTHPGTGSAGPAPATGRNPSGYYPAQAGRSGIAGKRGAFARHFPSGGGGHRPGQAARPPAGCEPAALPDARLYRAELLNRSLMSLVHPLDREQMRRMRESLETANTNTFSISLRQLCANGAYL